MDEREWIGEGLRFGCTQCGHCCSIPGFVWVTEAEAAALATHLGLSLDAFGRRYLRRVGDRVSLVERSDGPCIFLGEDRRCTVYAARPRQCRTFPFWPGLVNSPETWAAVKETCPGIDSGPLHSRAEIEATLRKPT
ncbi:MAG: YkgJ family cysteine cluster protein [Planctomycetes bacterium]|nr:YkgJ family cysteine cluster protein [Planctomycetota bacterium]MBI3846084.1 YkgJ family cysteine cluster protein [Planctomycetota bacterium]